MKKNKGGSTIGQADRPLTMPCRACAILLLSLASVSLSCSRKNFSEKGWHDKVEAAQRGLLYAPHVNNEGYYNPWMPANQFGFGDIILWKCFSLKERYQDEEKKYLPEVIPHAADRVRALTEKQDFILWIGHSTFLIRINGTYWLTDPIFSRRAIFPKRKTPPAMTIAELNGISDKINIIVSHNHPDHLDRKSMLKLPNKSHLFVPLGLGEYCRKLNKEKVTEMDWWQSVELDQGGRLVCLPAQHWSTRIEQGYNESLWASFLIVSDETSIYFGGDSGYFIGYREIGKRFPGIDYALIPISAYHPRWFMHYSHMDVVEAIRAFRDLGARHCIPMHWGAFRLGDEPVGHPAVTLRRQIREMKLDRDSFIIPSIGEIIILR